MNRMRLVVVSLSLFLLAGCVPPDDYHPAATAQSQSRALSVYEEGIGYTKKDKFDEAIKCFDEAIKLDPEFAEAYIARGNALTDKHEFAKALADFDKLMQLAPNLKDDRSSIYIYKNMAICHHALKQWNALLADANKMISFNGHYRYAYMARALAYDGLGKPDLAKKDAATYEALAHPINAK